MSSNAERGIELLAIVFIITLLAGQALGYPLLLGYVQTGSMEPTLDPGDGFVSLPPELAGDPAVGDVIVYRAEQVNGGDLTTHRVVRDIERGYITRGDANPFTDQSAGEPPVRDPQVVAVGMRIGDTLLTIPELGTVVMAVHGFTDGLQQRVPSHILIGVGVAGLFMLLASSGTRGHRNRVPLTDRHGGHNSDTRTIGARGIILLCGAVLLVTATASVLAPLGPTEYTVVSAEADLPGPGVIPAGETETTTYQVPGGTLIPVKYYIEPASEGIDVVEGTESGRISPNGSANATIRLSAPPETGSYRRYIQEYRYPLVFPEPVIEVLYRVDPLAPVVLLDMILLLPFVVAARVVGNRPHVPKSAGVSNGTTGFHRGPKR